MQLTSSDLCRTLGHVITAEVGKLTAFRFQILSPIQNSQFICDCWTNGENEVISGLKLLLLCLEGLIMAVLFGLEALRS